MTQNNVEINYDSLLDSIDETVKIDEENVEIAIILDTNITLIHLLNKSIYRLETRELIPNTALVIEYDGKKLEENISFTDLILNNGVKISGNFSLIPVIRKLIKN